MYGGIGTGQAAPAPPTSSLTPEEIDRKCQRILSEIERCQTFDGKYIESSALHSVPQTFVPSELSAELSAELDRLLTEQLLREERRLDAPATGTSPRAPAIVAAGRAGECAACGGPCDWSPFRDVEALARRRKRLYRELKVAERRRGAATATPGPKTLRSVVARSARNGGEVTFVRKELIKELSDEIEQIGSLLKLAQIDDELHRTCASRDASVSIRSIHGYPTTVQRQSAIWALEYEHNRHVAKMVALETIDSILEWMLEGWFFGERDTKDKALALDRPSFDQRGSLFDKASHIQWDSNADAMRDARAHAATTEDLEGANLSTKYGFFCLTFMYFRMLHVLRQEKATWSGSNDLVSMRHGPPPNEERKKMMQEEKNAAFRRNRLEYAMRKARAGEELKRQRLEKARAEQSTQRQRDNKKKYAEDRLANAVQRVFRGHVGRRVAGRQARARARVERAEALANDAATDIARAWRGYCGRLDAGYLRAEMAKFLFAIREDEARDEEEEYARARA